MILRLAASGSPGSLSITTLIHYLWALTVPWQVSLLPTLHFTQKQADHFINFSHIITIALPSLQNIQMAFREDPNRALWTLASVFISDSPSSSLPLLQPQELISSVGLRTVPFLQPKLSSPRKLHGCLPLLKAKLKGLVLREAFPWPHSLKPVLFSTYNTPTSRPITIWIILLMFFSPLFLCVYHHQNINSWE